MKIKFFFRVPSPWKTVFFHSNKIRQHKIDFFDYFTIPPPLLYTYKYIYFFSRISFRVCVPRVSQLTCVCVCQKQNYVHIITTQNSFLIKIFRHLFFPLCSGAIQVPHHDVIFTTMKNVYLIYVQDGLDFNIFF